MASGGAYPCQPGCMCGRHWSPRRITRSGEKICTKCEQSKPFGEFDVHHQGVKGPVYHARCKPCRRDDQYIGIRRRTFEKIYGITLEQYDEMLRAQGGVCAICDKPEWVIQKGKLRMLSVDHDHLTGVVRGLLCSNCNRAIGLLNDDMDTLKKAIHYLQSGAGYSE